MADDIVLPLDNVQGNILGGFFKDHQAFLFLTFNDRGLTKEWLRHVVSEVATSEEVIAFNNAFKAIKPRRNPQGVIKARWMNLALTHSGCERIGVPPDQLQAFPAEFQAGMRERATALGDTGDGDPANWVGPLGDKSVHALLLLAADDPAELAQDIQRHGKMLEQYDITLSFLQQGETRVDQPGHEHFGFDDGVSQPGVRDSHVTLPTDADGNVGLPGQDRLWPGEFVVGYPTQSVPPPPPQPEPPPPGGYPGGQPPPAPPPPPFDPHAPGPELAAIPDWTKDGSYLVFRRLRQNVPAFRQFIEAKSAELDLAPQLLMAKLVGRYQSGAPLERTHNEPADFNTTTEDPSIADPTILTPDKINNFDYIDGSNDVDGSIVPRAAHIRKVYPRDQVPPSEPLAEKRRILRRGIAYGRSFVEGSDVSTPNGPNPDFPNDRGLLFLCYQSSIRDKFEFLQATWANNANFPQHTDGHDPIIGQASPRSFTIPGVPTPLSMAEWVTSTGGEYFFQPSISALKQLASQ